MSIATPTDINGASSPVIMIRLEGRGEDSMRLEKRLYCAARALGINIKIDWLSNTYGDPVVWVNEHKLIDHLVETTELEILLQQFLMNRGDKNET
jgi:hypothetical protein